MGVTFSFFKDLADPEVWPGFIGSSLKVSDQSQFAWTFCSQPHQLTVMMFTLLPCLLEDLGFSLSLMSQKEQLIHLTSKLTNEIIFPINM